MADARGEYWYLGTGVDSTKITVPELRSILLKHGVTYPSSAKKAVLVALFDQHVAPQAAQIQRVQAHTKRSTKGIEDVPSSADSTTTDDAPPLPSTATAKRTTRHTMRAPHDESRTIPTKHGRGSDGEADGQPAMRRTRPSLAPSARNRSPDPEAWHRTDAESPFTQDNPFQSGSSPMVADGARDRRRKTMGLEQRAGRKSDAHRRKTFEPNTEQQDRGITVPTRRTFDMPVPRLSKKDEPPVEAGDQDLGEEFTPEEQLELVHERAKTGQVDILPPRRRKQTSRATGTLKAFSLTLLATTTAVLGGVWRQEKYQVGFCGVGRASTTLAGLDVPEWAGPVLPHCEPCPPHATCLPGLHVLCDKDFILTDHPLSLRGLVPLPPTCEPDSEKTRRVGIVADEVTQVLRKQKAKYECGEPDEEGKLLPTPQLSVEQLKAQIAPKAKSMSQEEFDELFDDALGEVTRREEIIESNEGQSGNRLLASDSLAELPLACSIRRSLRHTAERYIWQIILILLVLGSGSYGQHSFKSSRAMESRAKQLASDVFDRLANHATLNIQEPGAYPDHGISMTQLRDYVLRNEFSSSRRKRLWERVQKKVEQNSNVRAAVRENHSGDVGRMWEWVGPVQLLEEGGSSSKRESGRHSYGTLTGSSPPDDTHRQMVEKKSWEEGRPIY